MYEAIMTDNVLDPGINKIFFKVLGQMFREQIVGKILLQHVMDEIKEKYVETNNERYIEYLIILWVAYPEHINSYINEVKQTLSKRLQFMLIPEGCEKEQCAPDTTKSSIDYTVYITYMDEYNSIEDMLIDVGKNGNYRHMMWSTIKYTIDKPKHIDTVIRVLKTGIQMKVWTRKELASSVEHIQKHELGETSIDAPYFKSHLEKIKQDCGLSEKQDKDYRYRKGKNGNKPF